MGQGTRLNPAVQAGLPVLGIGILMLGSIGLCVGYPCFWTGIRYGMWVDRCPATDLRLDLTVEAQDLLRGQEHGGLVVQPTARWLSSRGRGAWERSGSLQRGFSVEATLFDDGGAEVQGLELGRFGAWGQGRRAAVTLPELPDGHYTLKVAVDAGFEATEVEVDLPLFTPALVHVMTDRPLYKPGQEVLFRSVVLERTDQGPLEGRPGRWRVTDPNGNEMLAEKDRAGPWGIAAGSFPLDARATVGRWTVAWQTGDASDQVSFDVRPFRLPRFTVDVAPSDRWYGIGDELVIEGRATYTSGAPVAEASVRLQLFPDTGRWPMPLSWERPITLTTAPDGRFEANIGPVPADLMDRTTLRVAATVTEAAGEVAAASSRVILSKDDLLIKAVTELGDGLVGGFNNRAYLRIATADDQPLAGAEVTVTNPYDPTDGSKTATADADGVVSIQLDPGDPVTVVDPAPPFRPRPVQPDPVSLAAATLHGLAGPTAPDLADRRALDALHPDIAGCGTYAIGNTNVDVAAQVDQSGVVRRVEAPDDVLGRCVAAATRRLRLPAGPPRTAQLRWTVPDSKQPWLVWTHDTAFGTAAVAQPLSEAGKRARSCLAANQGISGANVLAVHWATSAGSESLATTFEVATGTGLSPAALSCVQSALRTASLESAPSAPAVGVSRAVLTLPNNPGIAPSRPPPAPPTSCRWPPRPTAPISAPAAWSCRRARSPGCACARRRPWPPPGIGSWWICCGDPTSTAPCPKSSSCTKAPSGSPRPTSRTTAPSSPCPTTSMASSTWPGATRGPWCSCSPTIP